MNVPTQISGDAEERISAFLSDEKVHAVNLPEYMKALSLFSETKKCRMVSSLKALLLIRLLLTPWLQIFHHNSFSISENISAREFEPALQF